MDGAPLRAARRSRGRGIHRGGAGLGRVRASLTRRRDAAGDGRVTSCVRRTSIRRGSTGLPHWCTLDQRRDFAALVWILHQMIAQSGSMKSFSLKVSPPMPSTSGPPCQASRRERRPRVWRSMQKTSQEGVEYFFTAVLGGACKRSTCSCAGWCARTKSTLACGRRCGRDS